MEEKLGTIMHKCKTIKQLKQVHLQILVNGMRDSNHLATKLMTSLSPHMISFDYANKVFLDLPNPNLSSYNTLIKCSIGNSHEIAASAYNAMRRQDISSDSFTFTYLLRSFASFRWLQGGETVHGHVIKFGLLSNLFVTNALLDFYAKHGDGLVVARKFFDEMPNRDGVSWTTIVNAHMSCGEVHRAIGLLDSMPERHVAAWNSVIFGLGLGLSDDYIVNRDEMKLGYKLFQRMRRRNIASWNIMIQGLVEYEMLPQAFSLFNDMLAQAGEGCKPDETTLITILSACSEEFLVEQGKWLSSYIEENNYLLSLPLGNALIDMFVAIEDVHYASIIFMKMPKKCAITWRRMIDGLGGNGFDEETLDLFDIMCSEGQKPDGAILREVLRAFMSNDSLVGDGKRLFRVLHQLVHECGVKPSWEDYESMVVILSGAGLIEAAIMLAESMETVRWESCTSVWGNVLSACIIHGHENLVEPLLIKISNKITIDRFDLKTIMVLTISRTMCEKRNDPGDVKLMMEWLIKKIPNQGYNDPNDVMWTELLKELNWRINSAQYSVEYEEERCPDHCTIFQARQTYPPEEIYGTLESLHGQSALPLHHEIYGLVEF